MNTAVHFSSGNDVWATPLPLFRQLDEEFHFTLDVCAHKENAKCERFFSRVDNGLVQAWGREMCWMNPPYGDEIGNWMKKAYLARQDGATVVCLVPSRTDTEWWHEYAMHGEIRFIRGRLKFGGAKDSAPFPSAIVVFRPGQEKPHRFGQLELLS